MGGIKWRAAVVFRMPTEGGTACVCVESVWWNERDMGLTMIHSFACMGGGMKMRSKTLSGHQSGLIIQCSRQLNRAIMQDFAGLRRRWGLML